MKEIEKRLERLVRLDMENRNREAGFEMFSYSRTLKSGPYAWIEYFYRPSEFSRPSRMLYGGDPFTSKVNVMKEYLEECVQEKSGRSKELRSVDFYEDWFSGNVP